MPEAGFNYPPLAPLAITLANDIFNVKIDFYISPQTLDQYWLTLVVLAVVFVVAAVVALVFLHVAVMLLPVVSSHSWFDSVSW